MGIHSGPVNEVTDLNEQANIAGAGINIAQRVMDCGDAGHILLSQACGRRSQHYAAGGLTCMRLANARSNTAKSFRWSISTRRSWVTRQRPQNIRGAAPAKSVAVLPFVNLSADKHDEYLSDGMTEELINALASTRPARAGTDILFRF